MLRFQALGSRFPEWEKPFPAERFQAALSPESEWIRACWFPVQESSLSGYSPCLFQPHRCSCQLQFLLQFLRLYLHPFEAMPSSRHLCAVGNWGYSTAWKTRWCSGRRPWLLRSR